MREDFLHYVWKFQKFSSVSLHLTTGEILQILKVGTHNCNEGPDFLYGKIAIDNQVWVGNIEIHIKSSHWYAHHHEKDKNYDSVVLHVVWEHDIDIYRNNETTIPTLELKDRVPSNLLNQYKKLFLKSAQWIPCEKEIGHVDTFVVSNWLDRLYIERLEKKTKFVASLLAQTNNDWEAVLFLQLAKNFGLHVNSYAFLSIAQSIPYAVVRKCSENVVFVEALLMGQAQFFQQEISDPYFTHLSTTYDFLSHKYQLDNKTVLNPKFFRLRPPNFPTIRLSQLAMLFHKKQHLFSEIISAKTVEDFYAVFNVGASTYWDTHYNFGVTSSRRKKMLSKSFVSLIISNALLPLLYCFSKYHTRYSSETVIEIAMSLSGESNKVIHKYKSLRNFENNALTSQALLQLKSHYCKRYKCLQCEIGNSLLKKY